ncbi:hypothetical protein GCM10010361_30750 [Streptomyces olivaceiscleroticus]|uniref:Uncharacterized protein n=1 Tax=Streptomyces olivaceiscleroticus TaxID=68245 RepID=A0ABP3JYA1_9ACTN
MLMTSMQGYDKLVGRGEAPGAGGPGAGKERGVSLHHTSSERPAPAVRAAGACTAIAPPNRFRYRRSRTAMPAGCAGAAGRCARGPASARSSSFTACGYLDRAALRAGLTGRAADPEAPQGPDAVPALNHRTEEPGHPTEGPGHAEDDGESDHHERTGPRTAPAFAVGRAARGCREPLLLVPRSAALPCPGWRPQRASHQSPHRAERMR